jgi:hypothetical protein
LQNIHLKSEVFSLKSKKKYLESKDICLKSEKRSFNERLKSKPGWASSLIKQHQGQISHPLDGLDEKGNGAEAIVTTNEGGVRVLHPSIIKVSPTLRQCFHKRTHRLPCAVAEPFGLPAIPGDELLTEADITGMFNGILVLLDEVRIASAAKSSDPDIHTLNAKR